MGLDLDPAETEGVTGTLDGTQRAARRQRDRRMRELVLTAYEFQCAFCGYDGMLGASTVGLEAALVRWWSYDGPDEVDNGLCLCSLHHKLFDKGVLGLGEGYRILVSQRFVGRSEASRQHVCSGWPDGRSSARRRGFRRSRADTGSGTPSRSSGASPGSP